MPRRRQAEHDMEWELDVLARWKRKTSGVNHYEWDGETLIIEDSHGTQHFDRATVQAVIFANAETYK